MLEDHPHIPAKELQVLFGEPDLRLAVLGRVIGPAVFAPQRAKAADTDRAGTRPLQKIDASHQGALAGAGVADDAVNIALPDLQNDVIHRVNVGLGSRKGLTQCL